MTVNNPEAFMAGVWDWGILDGCFGETRIKPTDIDGMVERHGRFLWLETKAPGVDIPIGQQITFEAARLTGLFTILIIWGDRNQPQRVQLMTRQGQQNQRPANLETVRHIVSAWFKWADEQAVYGQ